METQLAAPNPIAADYTRKSIAEFVKQYPNVGLMVCLGEALQGNDNQKEWLCDVILPGVKDGMKEAGMTRGAAGGDPHACDGSASLHAAMR